MRPAGVIYGHVRRWNVALVGALASRGGTARAHAEYAEYPHHCRY